VIFDVLTLFPEIFRSYLSESLLAKAIERDLIRVDVVDIRGFAQGKHRQADDRPFGGGAGMVMMAEPLALAIESRLSLDGPRPLVISLSPSGRLLDQRLVQRLAGQERLLLICGRYEGVDQRVLDLHAHMEISIGDYVLSGGEVPAMAIIEAVSRLIPGYMGKSESTLEESHSYGLLEYPLYTRPRIWRGKEAPTILFTGHHAQIAAWRLAEAVEKTKKVRPELLERPELEEELLTALEGSRSPLSPKN
jgi:tRNA (guanine37-N1)-methyltransferase